MTIATGTRFGSYEVVAQIGAGGMGEVYQAHDTKLGRDVAIKVLPDAFAHDPDRLSRFQREAKMLASLNHPNIATIHGLEQSNGTNYLVMELVAGETLADRSKREGALPVEEALTIAQQIAEALEAAHEKGIVHRDLKPANVKVTPDGKVKVLDFGLAKAFSGDTAESDPINSPTLSQAATMQGVILGTAGYMSPEQARGKAVDKRTDMWAFGCVLYEMLTGKQAFQGETVTDIIAKILTGDPDWQMLPSSTSAQIRTLLRRSLQKDKTLRMRDAGDARIEIQEALTAPTPIESALAARSRARGWRQAAILALVGVILLAIVGLATWNLKPASATPARPITRFTITLPPSQQLGFTQSKILALSPDGSYLAYVASQGGIQQIYLRAMDSLEARPISGTEGGFNPFFSTDSQWIGFFARGKLKKIPVRGGTALTLADAVSPTGPRGAAFGSWGTIVFSPGQQSVLQLIPETGGTPHSLTRLETGEDSHRWPEFLPGGKALFFEALTQSQTVVVVLSIQSGHRRDLVQGESPHYVFPGYVVYAQAGNLMAMPFDSERLEIKGPAIPVVENVGIVGTSTFGAPVHYSVSDNGSLAYVSGGSLGPQRRLVWVSRNSQKQSLPAPLRPYRYPRVSPNGRQVAVTIDEQGSQIWLYDLVRQTLSRLTFEGLSNVAAVWTPDGKRIAFQSNSEGPQNLFWQLADGSGGLERLTTNEHLQTPGSWSSNDLLAYHEINPTTGYDVLVLHLRDRKIEPFAQTRFNESAPHFSPDGHWLAYISDETGRPEIYVRAYPGPGGKWQISTDGGTEPVWNPNGRELFYRSSEKMMAVEIATEPSFAAGNPRMLFEGHYGLAPTQGAVPNYDVSPDGQRFLMVEEGDQQQAPSQINVVLNWSEELKQKVPIGKK